MTQTQGNIKDSHTPHSVRDLWITPRSKYEWLNANYHFDTDVCACDQFHHHENYITAEMNALAENQPWGNVNFINPPFTLKAEFVAEALKRPGVHVMILPADTGASWFHLAWANCKKMILLEGRVSFIDRGTLKPVHGNNIGTVIFVFDSSYCGPIIHQSFKTREVNSWYRKTGLTWNYDRLESD